MPDASSESLLENGAAPGAVILLGKERRLRPERATRELRARAAAAALLFERFDIPILTVEGELRGSEEPGSTLVKRLLEELGVPTRAIITRRTSNATLVEVLTTRACLRAMRIRSAIAVTSGYHVKRAQRYFDAGRRSGDVEVDVSSPELVAERFSSQLRGSGQAKRALALIEASRLTTRELAEERRQEWVLRGGAWLLGALPRRLAWAIELWIAGRLRGTPEELERLARVAREFGRSSE